jgi:hypothetical protein
VSSKARFARGFDMGMEGLFFHFGRSGHLRLAEVLALRWRDRHAGGRAPRERHEYDLLDSYVPHEKGKLPQKGCRRQSHLA